MARKRSYRKYRNRSQRGADDLDEAIFRWLIGFVLLLGIWFHFKARPYLESHMEQIMQWTIVASIALILSLVLLVWFFLYKRHRKSQLTVKDGRNAVFVALIEEIRSFSSVRKHWTEAYYQMELAGYLKKTFPNLDIEETRSDTRPDIVVWNIAIEIKWPTWKRELRTIADKIIRYLKHYDNLVVILFDLQVAEDDYADWENWIFETFSNKSDSLEILVK